MIPISSGGGAGIGAFPDPPHGDPGQIAAAARRLGDAGGYLEDVDTGLRTASGEVAQDWQGYAAGLYHGCTTQLSGIAHGAAQTFRDCQQAVSSYGQSLDDVQQKVNGLKTQYDDAVGRQQTAANQALGFSNQITPTSKPADVTRLSGQASDAARQAGDATRDANHYILLATQAISDFRDKARGYASTLEGIEPGRSGGPLGSPFIAGGSPGPTFGFPGNWFSRHDAQPVPVDLTGVARVGDPNHPDIPGYGMYEDHQHGNLQGTDDLTNLILLLGVPVVGKAAEGLGGAALDWLTSKGVDKAGQVAIDKIEQKVLEGSAKLRTKIGDGARSALRGGGDDPVDPVAPKTPAELEREEEELTKQVRGAIVDIADKAGTLPDGVGDIAHNLLDYGGVYRAYTVSKLIQLREALAGMDSAAARAGVTTLNRIIDAVA
jgi:uncharacterized protein YukE